MKSAGIVGLAFITLASACTIVAPGNPDGGGKPMPIPIPIRPDALPQPKPLEASVLVVANLERSSANLADQYAGVMAGLGTYLQKVGLDLQNMGLIATYGDHWGPRLLLGRQAGAVQSASLQLIITAALAGNVNIQDYDHLLPYIGS